MKHTPEDSGVTEFQTRGASQDLVVLVHAFTSSPQRLEHVRNVVAQSYPNADILSPQLPFGMFSTALPHEIVADLLIRIDRAWEQRIGRSADGYKHIIFVGHSIGALYARKLYVCACGESLEAPFESDLKDCLRQRGSKPLDASRPWADRVERIVLLAGMNRGWVVSHHLSFTSAIVWSFGVAVGNVLRMIRRRPPIIFTIRKGAPFITQLRIQWLVMRRLAATKARAVGKATTIQLLGSIDDMVSPEDNIDLVAGRDFIYIDVPQSGHANVIEMDDTAAGLHRRDVFQRALTASGQDLEKDQVIPADATLAERTDVTDVVFVIHGIRDVGYWTHKIARRAIAEGRKRGKVIASETSTYGYFPMLSFLLPGRRRAKVEWLMDQYAEALAMYPNAEFSYIGHSNGTYLLARALEEYPSCRFKRVVFAGSVVRRKYEWSRFIPGQVQAVVNYVATRDWVVAYFPKGLETLHLQDLGSAGHDGFERANGPLPVFQPAKFVRGGHSAALQESMWDCIAHFIITGEPLPLPDSMLKSRQAWWVRYPAKVAPLIWISIVAFLGYLLVLLLGLPVDEWLKTVIALLYFGVIWKVITRV